MVRRFLSSVFVRSARMSAFRGQAVCCLFQSALLSPGHTVSIYDRVVYLNTGMCALPHRGLPRFPRTVKGYYWVWRTHKTMRNSVYQAYIGLREKGRKTLARGQLFPVASSSFAQMHCVEESRQSREGGSDSCDGHMSGVLWDVQG